MSWTVSALSSMNTSEPLNTNVGSYAGFTEGLKCFIFLSNENDER